MIKNLIEHLDYSLFAEGALLIFAGVFVAVTLRTLVSRKETMAQHANIVLEQEQETERVA